MADSYEVDPNALNDTAKGIKEAIAELQKLGFSEGGEVGRGFSDIALTGMQVGNGDLQGALDAFCERWGWGVRRLVHDGNDIALKLGLSAGMYYDQEQYVSGAAKDVANAALMGNPNLTQKQIEGQSWNTVASDNLVTEVQNADYSGKSFDQAMLDSRAAWDSTGADILTSDPRQKLLDAVTGQGPANAAEADRLKAEAEQLRARAQAMGGQG
ncbi:hypothetical protein ACFYNO_01490 [Kitasatospora sp. NPDC006697]|uniref:hypothetical protein n=1 Tax=Kitasatospora sp. NPDC006697 TaxID=3364020 RepID=UPI0036750205